MLLSEKKWYNHFMEEISISRIVQSKVLKFDLYDLDGNKIFSTGEILTPGKIMKIKEQPAVFKKRTDVDLQSEFDEQVMMSELQGAYNRHCIFSSCEQHDLISDFADILSLAKAKDWDTLLKASTRLKDIIVKMLSQVTPQIKFSHEVKLIGDMPIVHPINVALYSTLLAMKLELKDIDISNIALGALLHDIGKVQVSQEALDNPKESKTNNLMYQSHTVLGYRILKNNLSLPTNVARVALEHHEMMDGSGWPYGISNTMISEYAQLITVCNVFDNSSTSTSIDKNPMFSNVLKELLKLGSKVFSPKDLYTFVHMFNYSDTVTYWDLINDEEN